MYVENRSFSKAALKKNCRATVRRLLSEPTKPGGLTYLVRFSVGLTDLSHQCSIASFRAEAVVHKKFGVLPTRLSLKKVDP